MFTFRRKPPFQTPLRTLRTTRPRQPYSTTPPSPEPPPKPPTTRLSRLNARLPRFLHKYTTPLATAPLTHITSFLLLHELTALIPLFALAATFHYTNYLPPFFAEGVWVTKGIERFGSYFRRKGWIRSGDAEEAEREVRLQRVESGREGAEEGDARKLALRKRDKAWGWGEGGVRLVVEFATAYAITKALLPVRIVLSVWATPWFARWTVVPALGVMKRTFGRGKGGKVKAKAKAKGEDSSPPSSAAGTGAVEAGAVPKGAGKGK